MKCENCGFRWRLIKNGFPFQEVPGVWFIFFVTYSLSAGVRIIYKFSTARLLTADLLENAITILIGIFMCYMAVSRSGYREPTEKFPGSACPKCGTPNKIKPWNI